MKSEGPTIDRVRELLPHFTNIVEAACQLASKVQGLATKNLIKSGSTAYDIWTDIKDDIESFPRGTSEIVCEARSLWNELVEGDSGEFTEIVEGTRDVVLKYFDLPDDKVEAVVELAIVTGFDLVEDTFPEIVEYGIQIGESAFDIWETGQRMWARATGLASQIVNYFGGAKK